MSQFTITQGGLTISIEGESDHFFGQDLYTYAVTTLIEDADAHGWRKHNINQKGDVFDIDPEALENFCAAVLEAVARLYARESYLYEIMIDEHKSYKTHEVLEMMIEYLKGQGQTRLSQEVKPDSDDDQCG